MDASDTATERGRDLSSRNAGGTLREKGDAAPARSAVITALGQLAAPRAANPQHFTKAAIFISIDDDKISTSCISLGLLNYTIPKNDQPKARIR